MIRIFGDYYDRHGNKYKVVSFNGSQYACESFRTGEVFYFNAKDLSPRAPIRNKSNLNKVVVVKKEEPKIVEEVSSPSPLHEPVYEEPVYEEPVYEEKTEIQKETDLKDNVKETAEDDFYADF